ncbi:hypothetical protein [Buchananella felis]
MAAVRTARGCARRAGGVAAVRGAGGCVYLLRGSFREPAPVG